VFNLKNKINMKLTLTEKILSLILLILLVNYYNDYKEKVKLAEIKQQQLSNDILMDYVKNITN
jgi:hypothetical protein